jgi:hypothetical protein
VAGVTIRTSSIVIEARDYGVDGVDEDLLSMDEHGDRCVRYFVSKNEEGAMK